MSKLVVRVPNFPGKEKLAMATYRAGAKLSKHSPKLCIAGGIVLGVGATVLACRATLKVDEELTTYRANLDNIKLAYSKFQDGEPINYDEEKMQRDKFINFVQGAVKVGKLYAPAIVCGMVSIGLILGGQHIYLKRQAALTATCTAIQTAFDAYRKRVAEEVGAEKEEDIFNGFRQIVTETENDKGKIVKKKEIAQEHPYSPYARIFDETNEWWTKSASANKRFLAIQQATASELLRIRGHLYLNEVYRMLGFRDTLEGSICGWIYGEGDSFVSFGFLDPSSQKARDFINEDERSIWLDFNVDGVIYDKI